jgi:hypothetical protein
VARFLWGSTATLLLALLLLVVVFMGKVGEPPFLLLNPSFELMDEGVGMVMVCGKQPTRETVNKTAAAVVRDRWTGEMWTVHPRQDGCVVYYQHPRNVD